MPTAKKSLSKPKTPSFSDVLKELAKKVNQGSVDKDKQQKNENDFHLVSVVRDLVAAGVAAKEKAKAQSKTANTDDPSFLSTLSGKIKEKLSEFCNGQEFDLKDPMKSVQETLTNAVNKKYALPGAIVDKYHDVYEVIKNSPAGPYIDNGIKVVGALYEKAEPFIDVAKDKAKDILDVNKDGELSLEDVGSAVGKGKEVIGKVARKLPDISGIENGTSTDEPKYSQEME